MEDESVLTMWRADGEQLMPVLVACPDGLYPAKDADGVPIYENTHFQTRLEAWSKIRQEAEAAISIIGRDIGRLKAKLRQAEADAGIAAKRFAQVCENQSHKLGKIEVRV